MCVIVYQLLIWDLTISQLIKKQKFGPKDPAMQAEDTFSCVEGVVDYTHMGGFLPVLQWSGVFGSKPKVYCCTFKFFRTVF